MTLDASSMLDAALVHARRGWPVLPLYEPVTPEPGGPVGCSCGKAGCGNIGKHPRCDHGLKDATIDEAQIREWWAKWPEANIGVPTGAVSGMVVIDIDPRHGGDVSLEVLEDEHGKLPHTVEQLTGGGGRHLCFAHPGGTIKNRVGVRPGIDIRADGGYIVVEASLHETGCRYAFELSSLPGEVPLAAMPDWLEAIVIPATPDATAPPSGRCADPPPGAPILEGKRDSMLTSFAGSMRRRGMTQPSIIAALHAENRGRCQPPLPDSQVEKIARSITRYAPAGEGRPDVSSATVRSVRQLLRDHPDLRPPVIDGLLRRGELLNIVSASKSYKSWLATDLAICVAVGGCWLGRFATVQRQALIIDNELHGETSADRIPRVARARGVSIESIADSVHVGNVRGRGLDIFDLADYLSAVDAGRFGLVVLDALYRFIPQGLDENSNADMTVVYNQLDAVATEFGCAFVLVHHASKGNQSGKAVTDVGAGAGSLSRATDTHLILRPHEEEDAVVVEAAVRSWPPLRPFCLAWGYPVWSVDDDLDPGQLRKSGGRKKKESAGGKPAREELATAQFVERFVLAEPEPKTVIIERAKQGAGSKKRAEELLTLAESEGLVHRWKGGPREQVKFATRPPPSDEAEGTPNGVCVRARTPPHPPVGAEAPRGRGKKTSHAHGSSPDTPGDGGGG